VAMSHQPPHDVRPDKAGSAQDERGHGNNRAAGRRSSSPRGAGGALRARACRVETDSSRHSLRM
jgi:hypothetical protein